MIVLVTADNFLLMFVGWEGSQIEIKCPKWLIISDDSVLNFMFLMHTCNQKRFFFSNKLNSSQRIGPQNLNIISLIIGSLLSYSYLEKRGCGIRIIFTKCSNNVEYLMWFHSVLFNAGYCSKAKPKLFKLIGKYNKVLFIYSFKSYSFSSFIWLYNMFYRDNIKIIPRYLDGYFTPLALATLFLSSTRLEKRFPKTLFLIEDFKYLSLLLKKEYNIITIIKDSSLNACKYSSVSLYIENTSVSTFSKIIKPHLLHSQYHLLNKPTLKLTFPVSYGIHNYSYISKRGFSSNKDLTDIKYTLNYKREYILNLEQKEALIGIILGDGFLDRAKPNHNTRLRVEQSYPEKEKYLRSLYELLESMTTMSPTILTRKDKRSDTTTQSLYFRTLAMPCLNYYYDSFYKERVKIVPRNLGPLLTARGLGKGLGIRGFSTSSFWYKSSSSSNSNVKPYIIPVKIYLNADKDKELIYKDNRNKCGIYCWENLNNHKCYVGSSINLSKRFSWYYSLENQIGVKKDTVISQALLKYGYSGFSLKILEYCEASVVLEREQIYMDALNPSYNVLKIAGSVWGCAHTEETIAKFKARVRSSEHQSKILDHLAKHNASEEQRIKARERILAINENKGIKVEVADVRTQITTTYTSIRKAAEGLGTDSKALQYNERVQREKGIIKLFKKYYIVKISR